MSFTCFLSLPQPAEDESQRREQHGRGQSRGHAGPRRASACARRTVPSAYFTRTTMRAMPPGICASLRPGPDQPQGEILLGQFTTVDLAREDDVLLAGDVARVDGHDLAGRGLDDDVVALARQSRVVGSRAVAFLVVDHAGHEIERYALPARAGGIDPAGPVAARRGAVDVGGLVELAGHRALELDLPLGRSLGHGDALDPLDRPMTVHDLAAGLGSADHQTQRALVFAKRLASRA